MVLESVPAGWASPQPTAVLVHGLASCAEAPYMVRLGVRLVHLGIRVVRVNLRNSGIGFGLARGIYHAGRSDDLREVLAWLKSRDGVGPIALIGFSLGANLVLKLASEAPDDPGGSEGLDCVLAANPPIDLIACSRQMSLPQNRFYDWNFVKWLRAMIRRLHCRFPELGPTHLEGVKTVYEFDDRYTAPRNGFASADEYYERCSLMTALERIAVPGLIVHAMDDPFIPPEPFGAWSCRRISRWIWCVTAATWATSAVGRGRATAAGWTRVWMVGLTSTGESRADATSGSLDSHADASFSAAVPLGNLAAEEVRQFFRVIEVQLEGNPVASRLVEDGRLFLPMETHPRIAPDQAIIFISEPKSIPLSDPADSIAERRADGIDGILGLGVGEDGFGIDPDGVDGADRLQVVAQPSDSRGRTAGVEAVDELGDFFGAQSIRADGIALDGRPDILEHVEFRTDGQVVAEGPGLIDRPDGDVRRRRVGEWPGGYPGH